MSIPEILNELETELRSDESSLREWNVYYFNVHRRRYLQDANTFREYYQGGKILEIGSAPYHVTYMLHRMSPEVTGVDIAPERHTTFIEKLGLNIEKCNIETELLPFADRSFHYILLNEVFEHLRINPIQTLREINRVLHPNGTLILTTPNLYSIQNIVNLFLGKGFDNPYEEFRKLETLGQMGHVREYSVNQIRTFLNHTGFQSLVVKRNSYTPLKGYLYPFGLVRTVFARYNTFQMHICRKINPI